MHGTPHTRSSGHRSGTRSIVRSRFDPVDIGNAVAWLVSDAARYVTGAMLPVDAGLTINVTPIEGHHR
ncbi:MAG TPA: SDR family oxidoreductase [Aldersonia sp.]